MTATINMSPSKLQALTTIHTIETDTAIQQITNITNSVANVKKRKLSTNISLDTTNDKISQRTVNITADNIIPKIKRTISSPTNNTHNIYHITKHSKHEKVTNIDTLIQRSINTYKAPPYTTVPSHNIPTVSYTTYIALCDIKQSTRKYLHKSKVYDAIATGGIDPPHKSPWPVIKNNQCPVQLQQYTDTNIGVTKYRVVTKHSVKRGEVLCWYAGILTESSNLTEYERNNNSIILRNDFLQAYFEYQGPELSVNATQHKSVAYYIRDAIYNDNEETNCTVDVIYDDKSCLFYVFYYATNDILADEEIFGLRQLGSWRNLNHRELYINARISHWQHQWCSNLESKLLKHKIDISNKSTQYISINTKVNKLNEEERRIYWSNELERITTDYELSDTEAMRILKSQNDAFLHDNTTPIHTSELGVSIQSTTRDILAHKGQFIPAAFKIGKTLHYVDKERVKFLIQHGVDDTLVEIRELIELRSPPRYYCPPWYKSHCVVAKKFIPAGTLICTYAGVLDEEVQNAGSMCAYNLFTDQCIAEFGPSYKAPNLLLDASKKGNIGKYINDCKYRTDTSTTDYEFQNVKLLWIYDKIPHMIFYSIEDIEAGDELIQDYGHEFWNIISKQLMNEHWRYQNYIFTYNERLEQLCQQHKIKLPEKPSYLLEATKLFTDKPVQYPNKWVNYHSDKQLKVESILDKRADADGSNVQYLIQWRGFPEAMNSWESITHIECPQMIERYELLQCIAQHKVITLTSELIRNGIISDRDLPQTDTEDDSDDDTGNIVVAHGSSSTINTLSQAVANIVTNVAHHIDISNIFDTANVRMQPHEELDNESKSISTSQLSATKIKSEIILIDSD